MNSRIWRWIGFSALSSLGVAVGADLAPTYSSQIQSGRDIAVNGVSHGVPACAACHLAEGQGRLDVGIPRLAGLPSAYIYTQLRNFADGRRIDDIMSPYAKLLKPEQMRAVAAYFASRPISSSVAAISRLSKQTLDEFSAGRKIADDGIPEKQVPACALCHGASGLGVGAEFPPIAGQSRGYLIDQLQAWQAGRRRTPLGKFMRAEVGRMTPAEIQAVATYYALLPYIPKQNGDEK